MKKIENVIKKRKLRIAVFLLMMLMIIGTGQAWGAAPDWSQMGPDPITTGSFNASSIVVLNGTPYLAYTKFDGAGVLKYNGSSWSAVGSSFTTDQCNNVAMVASGTTLYVAYSDVNFDCINVVKCDTASGTVWSSLGQAADNMANSKDSSFSLDVKSDSDIYMGYTDDSPQFKVYHYNGSSWAWQFNATGSDGCSTALNGTAYAAYKNGTPDYQLYKNFNSGWESIQSLNGPPLAICHDDSNKIYILTEDRSSSPISLSVVCYDISHNTCAIVGSKIQDSSVYSPSISVDNGTVYVMYYKYYNNSYIAYLYAHESTADWVQAGSSIANGYYGDMTAYNGTVYYAYANAYNLTAKKIIYPAPVPKVTSLSPTAGPEAGGTSVTITGANFTGATAVNFGTTPAGFTVDNSTQITATAPAGTGTVDVTVTGPDGTSATSSNDRFTYYQAPTVTGISPVSGPAAGGSVTITGTNFTGATAVSFGAAPATSFTAISANLITATAPAGSGTVHVIVTGPGGTSATSSNDQFTYYLAPTVTGISPSKGWTGGGTSVTITGTNFTGATAVSFGAVSATSFTVNSSTQVTATAPTGIGTVDVRVAGPGGTSAISASDQYTYQTHYNIVIGTLSGGSITASPITEVSGATITLVVTPDLGKRLKAGTLKYNDGTDHSITGTSFIMPAATVTVTAEFETAPVSQAPGGGSSGSKGSGTSSDKPKTDVSVSGNTSVATTTTKATVDSGGKASAAVTSEQIGDAVSKSVAEAKKQGNGTSAIVEVKVDAAKDAKAVETKVPKASVDTLVSSSIAQLNVSTPVADIAFDSSALSGISGEASGDIKITASKVEASTLSTEAKQVVGDRPVFNFNVASGDRTISQFGGNVTVSVPYSPKPGEDTNAIVIYYINAAGKPEMVSDCVYNAASGNITFNTNHFSQYAVGYHQVTFKDVAADSWYGKAVEFIAAREITTGTSSGYFSPQAKLTRGQFIVMLMKAYGIAPDVNPKENFADAGSTYYTDYLAAAKRLGITAGVGNNLSAPDKEITRQEMFTLMYNALKSIGKLPQGNSGESLSSYSDAGNIASWAKDAVKLFAETGIINGSGNKLSPKDTTTRAQMAQVLYSLLSK